MILFLLFAAFIVVAVMYRRLTSYETKVININNETKTIEFVNKNAFGKVMKEQYQAADIYFSYRKRNISRYQGQGFFHDNRPKVCIIDTAQKTVGMLMPGKLGWNDKNIAQTCRNMQGIGVKRITEKYSDDEGEL
ncbi:hypothetical protein DYU05_16490 [Mucilaginibacter terrenus]|uniref:Uncharacterized protein n=1 Tax=Mucilaginibacter terrenus TaxID=2482727 RepID=A0A3E2NMJ1_9SPHI|nr:hypothetical protein [Mucilaginibacter terrenus]RFZ82215.1 hypothetical protein DYU05_16490 [Mucilaginibacter terrenus]